ncbi:restriction endonuclease subunit S [Enterococcus cecorum]|uniref:restriction endonuclease subunit S n=1 Tax=Enterococcus cecorum TaxID=44008 RepID=UPI000ADB5427|nr:restriction endonuclease subunit S [Enterococcus cecorum]CAI3344201.1 restriction endonuclease subunit S [Enterococcus cecorum]
MREMKDSGIEWIGEIPKDWELYKGKYVFTLRKSYGNTKNLQLLSPTQNYGVIPQTLYEELSGMRAVKLDEKTNLNLLKTIHEGDFCISLRSFQGGFEYSKYEGVVSPAYQIFYPIKDVATGYYKYLFKERGFIDKINSYTMPLRDGKNIAFSDFGNTYIPVPPLEEQHRIADYLDHKCSEIDSLVADIQSQIETMEQYKKSVITEAVTKGLEPNVEMKDSGIEWIGEIPRHWEVHPVYTYFGERKNKNKLGKESNLLSLSYGRIIRKDINTNNGLLPESFNTYNIVEAGDIIIRPTDLQNDKRSLRTGLVKEHGIITSAYIDLCPIKKLDSRYFHFLLHTYDVMKVFYNMGNGVRQGLNYSEFSHLMVFEPSYNEQITIANYLDDKIKEVDIIINQKQDQLSVLEQYKKSLIYEYVTGKKEVPKQ